MCGLGRVENEIVHVQLDTSWSQPQHPYQPYLTIVHLPLPYHKMKKQLLALKSRVSSSNRKKRDRLSPALDKARTVCQLLSNLGSGGINVPGLQAAGLVAVQIIDIIKVGKLLFEQRSVDEHFTENKRQRD